MEKKFWETEEIIGSFEKNKREKIQIKLCTLKDCNYIDIRTLVKANTSDEYLNTSKGICLSYELYSQMKDIIDKHINNG